MRNYKVIITIYLIAFLIFSIFLFPFRTNYLTIKGESIPLYRTEYRPIYSELNSQDEIEKDVILIYNPDYARYKLYLFISIIPLLIISLAYHEIPFFFKKTNTIDS